MRLSEVFARQFASVFQRLTEEFDDSAIVGLGVHSDADATGLVFAVQSRESRDQQLTACPEYPSDAIWSIGDWDVCLPAEVLGTGAEGRVHEAVVSVGEAFGDDIVARREHVWGAVVEAMSALHRRGFFDRWPGSVRVFLVMDGSNDEKEVHGWHTRFNDEDALRTLPAFLTAREPTVPDKELPGTDEDLFKAFIDTTPETLIQVVEALLLLPWNTGADVAAKHTIQGMAVTSSEDADGHELEFIRSTDFAGDAGERFTAVMNRVAPVIASIDDAMIAAWGEPSVLRPAEDLSACTLLEVIMNVFGADEVLAWPRDERYILFFEGVQQDSDQYAAAFWVASRRVVEDIAYDIAPRPRDDDPQRTPSAVEQHLAERLGPEVMIPAPLCRAWSFMQEQGWGSVDVHGDPILTPYPGEERLGAVFSSSLSTCGWLDPDAPGAERLLPIAQTDGSGGFAAIWFDDAGAPRFVWFSSEGGEPQRLADDPVDFLRLIAMGYGQFADWVWGAPPGSIANTHPEEEEGGEELLASDPVVAHREFRAWVEAEFDVEVPEVWTVSDDPEFEAWLEAMVDAHGIGAADPVGLGVDGPPSPGEPGEDTALHRASRGLASESLQRQLNAGADPNAVGSRGWTPLDLVAFGTEYWQAQKALDTARPLIAATEKRTIAAQAASHLRREFRDAHRAHANGNLSNDQLQAFGDLLQLLSVPEPVLVKPLARGEQITVTSQGWKRQFSELWQLLVPENGPAASVQGEVIRIAGRVGREILTNGGGNWDEDFEAMLDAFLAFTAQGEPLPDADHDRARQAAQGLRGGQFSEEDVDELTRTSVAWALLNPSPIPMPSQPYRR